MILAEKLMFPFLFFFFLLFCLCFKGEMRNKNGCDRLFGAGPSANDQGKGQNRPNYVGIYKPGLAVFA